MPDCLQTYQERPWIDRPCTGKPGIFWRLEITNYKIQNTHSKLQIAHAQGSQGSSEDCNGQSVEETEEDEHWRGEETDSSSDNNNTVSFLHFHHLVWHLSVCQVYLNEMDPGGEYAPEKAVVSWRLQFYPHEEKKHCTFPGSRARSVFKLGGEDCGPRERLLGAPPLHWGHPDAAISLTWSSSWSWLWPPCWYMVLRLHGLRACYRYM